MEYLYERMNEMDFSLTREQEMLKKLAQQFAETELEPMAEEIDREHYIVRKGDETIVLPRKEFALLELLHSQPGKLFTREEIYSTVWGNKVVVGDRTIDVHIRKLRQKIGEEHIVTVKGVGYKYEEAQAEEQPA